MTLTGQLVLFTEDQTSEDCPHLTCKSSEKKENLRTCFVRNKYEDFRFSLQYC